MSPLPGTVPPVVATRNLHSYFIKRLSRLKLTAVFSTATAGHTQTAGALILRTAQNLQAGTLYTITVLFYPVACLSRATPP
jgi:hypothetical protein